MVEARLLACNYCNVGLTLPDEIFDKGGYQVIDPVARGLSATNCVSCLASFCRMRLDEVKYLPLAEPQAGIEVWLMHHRGQIADDTDITLSKKNTIQR